MHRSNLFVAVPAAVLFSLSAAAAEPASQPEVLVTASRAELELDRTLAAAEVIDREAIAASATLDLVELLRQRAGLDIVRGGGFGQQTSVFLRGSNANHVLVLVDGVRIASTNTGAYAWEHLPLEQVERIEIVRGPRATLYGSDAIGGVIQIFTRRPDGLEGTVAAASHQTYGGHAGFGQRGARGGFGLAVGLVDSEGFSSQSPDGFAYDPDDDGFRQRWASLDADFEIGGHRLGLVGRAGDDDAEFDQGESNVRDHSLALSLDGALSPRWDHRLLLATQRETLVTPDFFSRLDSRRRQADWLHDLRLGERDRLQLGLGWLGERGASTSTFDDSTVFDDARTSRALYGSWRGERGGHGLELGARLEDSSTFGSETTWQAAWGVGNDRDGRWFASAGEGFRAPNFNELFSPGFGGLFAGNPSLDPERSRSVELGWRRRFGQARIGATAWRSEVDDLIDFAGVDFAAINIRRARIDGLELEGELPLGAWQLAGNLTWQDPRDRDSGQRLLRRPPRKLNLALNRGWESGARIGVELHAAAGRRDVAANLPGYGTLAVAASWPLSPKLALEARVDNLLDRDYVLVGGFNTPGRSISLRLRWAR